MNDIIEVKSTSIVIIGNFNPSIIQPFWLAQKGLIREEEAENATIDFIHNEISRFNLDWAVIEVRPDRFEINTDKEPYFEIIRDLCIGIFAFLKETPIKAIGINNSIHLQELKPDKYKEIGDKLVPLKNWSFLRDPGVLNVEILEKKIEEKDGYLRVIIQPSDKIPSTIMFKINDHYNLSSNNSITKNEVATLLAEHWNNSLKNSEEIVHNLWNSLK